MGGTCGCREHKTGFGGGRKSRIAGHIGHSKVLGGGTTSGTFIRGDL